MTSDAIKDISESIGKGATKGLLEYSESKIKELVSLFKNKKLRFIGDKQTIQVAKETRNSGEWAFYKEYVKEKELLFIIKLGLVLRKIENNKERLQNLKEKIKNKNDVKGLHIAYFVQNGILNRYVGILLDNLDSANKLRQNISNTLKNIEKHAIFVDWRYDFRQLLRESMTLVAAHTPDIFVISGISTAAKIVISCELKLKQVLKKYELEKISTGDKEVLFFKYTV